MTDTVECDLHTLLGLDQPEGVRPLNLSKMVRNKQHHVLKITRFMFLLFVM